MGNDFTPNKDAIIIDASFLDFITSDFKTNFERILDRQLNEIDLSELISYVAMDWGITDGGNEIDVYITFDNRNPSFHVCYPSDISSINGMAFKNRLGEFSFYTYSNESMASSDEFFLDALLSLLEEENIKRLAVIGFNEHYEEDVDKILAHSSGKIITKFVMPKPQDEQKFATKIIAYPIMMALGIRSEELG